MHGRFGGMRGWWYLIWLRRVDGTEAPMLFGRSLACESEVLFDVTPTAKALGCNWLVAFSRLALEKLTDGVLPDETSQLSGRPRDVLAWTADTLAKIEASDRETRVIMEFKDGDVALAAVLQPYLGGEPMLTIALKEEMNPVRPL